MKNSFAASFLAGLCLTSPLWAHHSNSIFDLESVVALEGTVTRYDWRNPHVYIYVAVTDVTGRIEEWEIEGDPTSLMTRSGWSVTTLTAGDHVTARVSPDRNASRSHALLRTLTTPDGRVLTPRSAGRESTARATSLAGVWDAVRGFAQRSEDLGVLTPKGATALAGYTPADSPVADCVAYTLPTIAYAPYLNEVEIRGDRILIRSEFFDVERTIFMDGRGHSENGERTNQGHSIGRWEGDTLVVDTRLFANHRTGNRTTGVPSGPQKHVIERYTLSDDGTRVDIDYVLEDPEYLAKPRTGRFFWDYAPDSELIQTECDPQNARIYAVE
jgi:hypothetical protein